MKKSSQIFDPLGVDQQTDMRVKRELTISIMGNKEKRDNSRTKASVRRVGRQAGRQAGE